MRLATVKINGEEKAGIVTAEGIVPISAVNAAKGTAWKEEMYELICAGQIPGITAWYNEGGKRGARKDAGDDSKRESRLCTSLPQSEKNLWNRA